MLDLESAISHAIPFLLVLFRLAGMFIFTPLLASSMLPRQFKALLVMMLAAALYPMVPTQAVSAASIDLITLIPMIIREAIIGFTMGVLATIPLVCLEMSGVIMGQQMGFGLARVYNPELEFDADLIGQLFFYIGAAAFIAIGGLETLFITLANTFARVPIGTFSSDAVPIQTLVATLTSGFELAMRVASPVAGIVALLVVAFGVTSKTMPQLNVMSIGFTFKILAGLGIAAFSIYSIANAAGEEIRSTLNLIIEWADHLAGTTPHA